MMVTVTCIVACYNAAATLEAAVRSALAQVDVDVEVIISDDASNDASLSRAMAMAGEDPRVRVVAHATRGGPSRARNKAIALAKGDWIAILDADDEMLPHRLSSLVARAQMHQSDIAFDNQQIISHAGDSHGCQVVAFDYEDGLSIDVPTFLGLTRTTADRLSIGYAKPIFSTSFLQRHAVEYDERFSVGEDWKFFLTALVRGAQCTYINDAAYLYYRSGTSLTLAGKNNYRVTLNMMRACQGDLANMMRAEDRCALRSLCGYFRRKSVEHSLRITARSLKSAVQLRFLRN